MAELVRLLGRPAGPGGNARAVRRARPHDRTTGRNAGMRPGGIRLNKAAGGPRGASADGCSRDRCHGDTGAAAVFLMLSLLGMPVSFFCCAPSGLAVCKGPTTRWTTGSGVAINHRSDEHGAPAAVEGGKDSGDVSRVDAERTVAATMKPPTAALLVGGCRAKVCRPGGLRRFRVWLRTSLRVTGGRRC